MIVRTLNLASMLRNERRGRDAIRRIQNDAFLRLWRHAYSNVPFYRDLYLLHGISIDDIRTLEDIGKLPVVSKEQLRSAAASGNLWGDTGDCYRVETSGSSGDPFRFYVSQSDNQWRKAQYLLPYVSSGRRPWDSVLHLKDCVSSRRTWFHALGLFNETQMLANTAVADQYNVLTDLKPNHLQGYPSVLRLLALHIMGDGLPCPPLIKVFTDSELLLPETRSLLQRAFRTDVVDVYGSFETDNIAYECALHNGYHFVEDSVIVETVTGIDYQPTEGSGELVCTVLHNTVTPFIRYNLGDLVQILSEPCACGRQSTRLSVLNGRSNDLIRLADGSKRNAMPLIRYCATQFLSFVKEFQIRQLSEDRFEVLLVQSNVLKSGNIAEFKLAFAKVMPSATTDFRVVDRIERAAAGKHKAFVGIDASACDTT